MNILNMELNTDCGQYIFGSEVFGTIPICFNPSKHSLGTCIKAKQNPAKLKTQGIINTEN